MPRTTSRVVVVGSLNVDYIATVEQLPNPGQTVPAVGLLKRFGGKGANQALAAARQGACVSIVGCLGTDDDGAAYVNRLQAEGIATSGLSRTAKALTGTALIAVDRTGENLIIVGAGANGELRPSALRTNSELIASAAIVLVQLEIPLATVVETIRLANHRNVPVVLNPSPLHKDFPWSKCRIETVIANAGEAEIIFGLETRQWPKRVAAWRNKLKQLGVGELIITRGSKPTLCLNARACFEIPTLRVKPLDTVGAGDAFAGTFAARRAEGADLLTAVRLANCAGALATLKRGAQESIPSRTATERAERNLEASIPF